MRGYIRVHTGQGPKGTGQHLAPGVRGKYCIWKVRGKICKDTNRGQEVLQAHDLALTFGIKVDSGVTNEFLSNVVRPLFRFILSKGNQVSLADEDFRTKIQNVLITAK